MFDCYCVASPLCLLETGLKNCVIPKIGPFDFAYQWGFREKTPIIPIEFTMGIYVEISEIIVN